MLILPITFEDLDGVTRTETFHFNMTQAEIAELELSKLDLKTEGFQDHIAKIIAARSGKDIIESIKAVILMSVGRREGDLFCKTPEITEGFQFSGAYSSLFTSLIGDPDYAAMFIRGIVPKSMSDGVQQKFEEQKAQTVQLPGAEPEDNRPPWIREDRPPTKAEMTSMSKDQLVEVMQRETAKGGVSNESTGS
jgi:hypothetical protein